MSKIILIVAAVIAGILAVMLLAPVHHATRPHQELLGMGKFVVNQNGATIITENYSLVYTPKDGYILISQAKVSAGNNKATLAQQYQLTPGFSLAFYQLAVETQSASQIVSAQPRGATLHLEVRAGKQVQTRDIPNRNTTFILDNNLVSQYQLLIMAARAEKLNRTFTAVVPQALLTLPAHLDGPDQIAFTSNGKPYSGKRYTLTLGDLSITIIMYNGHLAALFNPAQHVTAYDQTMFPHGVTYNAATSANRPATSSNAGREEAVTFTSGGVTLAGTLELPATGTGPFPAVLMIAGSGPVDRNENAPGLRTDILSQLAAAFATHGIASLRYDKRGVGQSGGDFKTASLDDFVADARAALAYLRGRAQVDPNHIFILGHSAGGIIGPMIAANDHKLAGLILLAAPAHPLDYIIRHQIEELNRAAGKTDAQVNAALAQEDQFLNFVRDSHGNWSDYTFAQLKTAMPWLTKDRLPQLTATSLAWLRENFHHDPLKTIAQVACPVLIIQGEKDFQVPATEATMLAQALHAAGNSDVTLDVLPNLNHLMRYQTEAPNLTYRHLDQPVDPRVIDAVTNWIGQRIGATVH